MWHAPRLSGFNCVKSVWGNFGGWCRGWAADLQLIFQPVMECRWKKYILRIVLAIWLTESNRKNEVAGAMLSCTLSCLEELSSSLHTSSLFAAHLEIEYSDPQSIIYIICLNALITRTPKYPNADPTPAKGQINQVISQNKRAFNKFTIWKPSPEISHHKYVISEPKTYYSLDPYSCC